MPDLHSTLKARNSKIWPTKFRWSLPKPNSMEYCRQQCSLPEKVSLICHNLPHCCLDMVFYILSFNKVGEFQQFLRFFTTWSPCVIRFGRRSNVKDMFPDSTKHVEQGTRESLEDFHSSFLDFLNGIDQNWTSVHRLFNCWRILKYNA